MCVIPADVERHRIELQIAQRLPPPPTQSLLQTNLPQIYRYVICPWAQKFWEHYMLLLEGIKRSLLQPHWLINQFQLLQCRKNCSTLPQARHGLHCLWLNVALTSLRSKRCPANVYLASITCLGDVSAKASNHAIEMARSEINNISHFRRQISIVIFLSQSKEIKQNYYLSRKVKPRDWGGLQKIGVTYQKSGSNNLFFSLNAMPCHRHESYK